MPGKIRGLNEDWRVATLFNMFGSVISTERFVSSSCFVVDMCNKLVEWSLVFIVCMCGCRHLITRHQRLLQMTDATVMMTMTRTRSVKLIEFQQLLLLLHNAFRLSFFFAIYLLTFFCRFSKSLFDYCVLFS